MESAAVTKTCNRRACQKGPANYFNASTREWYCAECARRINETAPHLCATFVRGYREWLNSLTDAEIKIAFPHLKGTEP